MTILRCLFLFMVIAQATHADRVERRGTADPVFGHIMLINDAGVKIRDDRDNIYVIPWDRVRDIDQKIPDPRLPQFLELADDLWRARSRVERLDTELAESILERLFYQYQGRSNETALVVAEGLLRCRLAHGRYAAAVIPALEMIRHRRAGFSTNSYTMLPLLYDEKTSLCPLLSPMWAPSRSVDKLADDLARYDSHGDEVVADLARVYRIAALAHRVNDEAIDWPEFPKREHPGVSLLIDCVRCLSDKPSERRAARHRLERRITDAAQDWIEAWSRFGVGLAYLLESGVGQQQRGMVNLLHLPAHYDSRQPYLAGLALAIVSERLGEMGDDVAADSLRNELLKFYPEHPVLHRSEGRPLISVVNIHEEEIS